MLGVAPDDAARSALEALMVAKEYKNDFFDRIEAQHDLVMSCTDPGQLDLWVDRALAATSADEVFKD